MTTAALVLALAGTARAETFCVQAPGCQGTESATVQAALTAADVDPAQADIVRVGPGTHEGPFTAASPVTVSGFGGGATVLRASGNGVAVLTLPAPGSGVEQLTVEGGSGIVAGSVVVRAVAIELDGPGTGVSLAPAAGDAALHGVTIAGAGAGTGLAAEAGSVALEDSVITGLEEHIRTTAESTVTTSHSAYDPGRVTGGVVGDPVTADPRLDADLRPRFDSPLIDVAGAPVVPDQLDASGLPRVVDGDGNGEPRRDIGALEYQRRAPEITASGATPGSALVGAPVAFSGTAVDRDGEPLTATWSFSDGATAAGLDVTHAFAAPGAATGTLTVADPVGLTATATVPVTISAPPPPPAGGGDPGPRGSPPRVLARVVPDALRLRAAAKRDRRPPYRFRLRGRVVLPHGVLTAGCRGGVVELAVRAGKRRLARTARLHADCSFRATLDLGRKRARRVVVRPRFSGTAALTPLDGKPLRLRAG